VGLPPPSTGRAGEGLYLMHDAVPKLVAIAVRMVITICITVFHVTFFIVLFSTTCSQFIFVKIVIITK